MRLLLNRSSAAAVMGIAAGATVIVVLATARGAVVRGAATVMGIAAGATMIVVLATARGAVVGGAAMMGIAAGATMIVVLATVGGAVVRGAADDRHYCRSHNERCSYHCLVLESMRTARKHGYAHLLRSRLGSVWIPCGVHTPR